MAKVKGKAPPIFNAVLARDLDALEELLKAGEDVNGRDRDGRTPLIHAAIDKDLDLAMFLLDRKADVNVADSRGWTALHFAAQEFDDKIASTLLKHGAKVDAQDEDGNTPLNNAVFNSRGRGEVIKLLLAYEANKNLKNKHGVSPLDLANEIANFDVAKFLR